MSDTHDCIELAAHRHPDESYASVRRQSAEFGWTHGDEYIQLHENPDAREAFQKEWGEPASLECFEDFEQQMRELEYDRMRAEEADYLYVSARPSWEELHPAIQQFLLIHCGDDAPMNWDART